MSIHHKGRVCLLDSIDIENLSLGIRPNCKDHPHVNRVKAFEISRNPKFGKVLAVLASAATTKENLAPAGCFIKIGGVVEYVHLRKISKPKLKVIYSLGEKIAAEQKTTFRRRAYYLAPDS